MKAIILLNGEPYLGKIEKGDAVVYCCDGAYEWAKDRVKIDVNLGDFDSLSYTPDPPPTEVYPSEKDYTDGELAYRRAVGEGATQIEFYGGGGGREDHFLGNLHLLYAACQQGVEALMITNHATIYCVNGHTEVIGKKGRTLSIVPFGGEVHILESGGLYYPLPEKFEYGFSRGVSNVVTEERAHFTTRGTALVFIDEEVLPCK